MKISDPVHALILYDQKFLVPWKTLLKCSAGQVYKFIKVDTRLNWPRLIVQNSNKNDHILSAQELKKLNLQILTSEIKIELVD